MQGNRIEASTRSRNAAVLSIGAEARGRHAARLVLRDNRFLATGVPARFVQVWTARLLGEPEIDVSGNPFEGPGRIGLPP